MNRDAAAPWLCLPYIYVPYISKYLTLDYLPIPRAKYADLNIPSHGVQQATTKQQPKYRAIQISSVNCWPGESEKSGVRQLQSRMSLALSWDQTRSRSAPLYDTNVSVVVRLRSRGYDRQCWPDYKFQDNQSSVDHSTLRIQQSQACKDKEEKRNFLDSY